MKDFIGFIKSEGINLLNSILFVTVLMFGVHMICLHLANKTTRAFYVTYKTESISGSMTIPAKGSDFPIAEASKKVQEDVSETFIITSIDEISFDDYENYNHYMQNERKNYERF